MPAIIEAGHVGCKDLRHLSSSLDTIIRVYNSQGQQIASDDDSGERLNARVNLRVTAGTYTIQVSGWNSDDVGPYTLHVLLQ